MNTPTIAQNAPFPVALEAGKTYYWCACGKSMTQPFCDGAHKGSPFEPQAFTVEVGKTVYLCGCKHTEKPPFCDGAHSSL